MSQVKFFKKNKSLSGCLEGQRYYHFYYITLLLLLLLLLLLEISWEIFTWCPNCDNISEVQQFLKSWKKK